MLPRRREQHDPDMRSLMEQAIQVMRESVVLHMDGHVEFVKHPNPRAPVVRALAGHRHDRLYSSYVAVPVPPEAYLAASFLRAFSRPRSLGCPRHTTKPSPSTTNACGIRNIS